MYFLLTGLIINAFITVTNSTSCEADQGWLEYEDKCLNHYSLTITWSGAHDTCVQLRQALLATVENPEINMFVLNKLTEDRDVWIGLSIPDISKPSWKWSDGGNTSHYDDWDEADVNSACAVMRYGNSHRSWYTIPCTNETSYVCEKEISEDNCSDWLSFDAHCYLIITEPTETNMGAARSCWQYNAYLISINSQQEADFIYSKLEISMEYWIGLSPLKWVYDVPYQWNNWGDSGPNITNRCVYMEASSGKWFCGDCENSELDDHHHSYICQRDAAIDIPSIPNVIAEEEETSSITVSSESNTVEFVTLGVSSTKSSTGIPKQLLITAVVPAVCGGLVVIIVVIIVVIVIRQKRRRLTSEDGKPNESRIYYNDYKKTTDNKNGPTIDSQASSVDDNGRSTYEKCSHGPYVNSGQITAGTYASLQNDQTKALQTSTVGESGGKTYEQLSQAPYVNSGQVKAGTYASLQ